MTLPLSVQPVSSAVASNSAISLRQGPSPLTRCATGIGEFATDYDLFMVDQWGVLHDGRHVFPGVRACLRQLTDMGKHVVILSNSGKPALANIRRLANMGIEETAYTHLITSGEVVRDLLTRRDQPPYSGLGQKCLFWGSDGGSAILDGLNLSIVESVSQADFILLAGVRDDRPLEYYQDILERAAVRGLTLICANPDTVRFGPDGLSFSAGEVASHYAKLGGTVHTVGKPEAAIYDYCFKVLGPIAPDRTIAIGDSLSHDILGGARAGIHTAFVCGGIHREEFDGLESDTQRLDITHRLGKDVGVQPNWVVPLFKW